MATTMSTTRWQSIMKNCGGRCGAFLTHIREQGIPTVRKFRDLKWEVLKFNKECCNFTSGSESHPVMLKKSRRFLDYYTERWRFALLFRNNLTRKRRNCGNDQTALDYWPAYRYLLPSGPTTTYRQGTLSYIHVDGYIGDTQWMQGCVC